MRADYKIFLEHITSNSKVIDIGCGEGEFLQILKTQKNCRTFGIELESSRVSVALSKGLSVIQGDGDAELINFPPKDSVNEPFDYAILAHTIQALKNPKHALENAKRISNKIVVSIPNFGFISTRLFLLFRGRMPVTRQLSYEWYETPNIHFSTIRDFINLINKVGLKIEKSYYVDLGGEAKEFQPNNPTIANLFGKSGVFILS